MSDWRDEIAAMCSDEELAALNERLDTQKERDMSKQITFTADELHIIETALRNEVTRLSNKADELFEQNKPERSDAVEEQANQADDIVVRLTRARYEAAGARFEASIA